MSFVKDSRGNVYVGTIDLINGNDFAGSWPVTSALAAVNESSIVELNGQSVLAVDARSGAFAGTLLIEGTVDGVNWIILPFVDFLSQVSQTSAVLAGVSANVWIVSVSGLQAVRARVSAYTSGSLTVSLRATVASLAPSLVKAPLSFLTTTLWVTVTAAANTAASASLPAAGAGLFHYITHIDITRHATAALAGGASVIHTTTNLPGSPAWSVGNAMAAGGTEKDVFIDFAQPLKSSVANTVTTVVAAAAGLAVLGRVNVGYYVGA